MSVCARAHRHHKNTTTSAMVAPTTREQIVALIAAVLFSVVKCYHRISGNDMLKEFGLSEAGAAAFFCVHTEITHAGVNTDGVYTPLTVNVIMSLTYEGGQDNTAYAIRRQVINAEVVLSRVNFVDDAQPTFSQRTVDGRLEPAVAFVGSYKMFRDDSARQSVLYSRESDAHTTRLMKMVVAHVLSVDGRPYTWNAFDELTGRPDSDSPMACCFQIHYMDRSDEGDLAVKGLTYTVSWRSCSEDAENVVGRGTLRVLTNSTSNIAVPVTMPLDDTPQFECASPIGR
jgi:hypothetical protein